MKTMHRLMLHVNNHHNHLKVVSPLWCLIDRHFADFEHDLEERFAERYVFYRRAIPDVVGYQ